MWSICRIFWKFSMMCVCVCVCVCVVKCVLGGITCFAWSVIKIAEVLYQGCTNFSKMYEPPQICRRSKGDMKLYTSWGPTNIRRHRTYSSLWRLGARNLCTPCVDMLWKVRRPNSTTALNIIKGQELCGKRDNAGRFHPFLVPLSYTLKWKYGDVSKMCVYIFCTVWFKTVSLKYLVKLLSRVVHKRTVSFVRF